MKIIKYNNIKLYVPDRYYIQNLISRFNNNNYEIEETYICNKYFDKNDYVLELGSCLGYTTCILSKQCKHVISIEGNPELKESLQQTKLNNNLDNVDLLNGYLDIQHKIVDFQTYDLIVASSGDREDNAGSWGKTLKMHKVKTITLDDIKNFKEINSLMIDIEGGELTFLKTFRDFISKYISKMCIEIHNFLMNDPDFTNKCLKEIEKMGFKQVEKRSLTYYFEK